MSRLRLMLLVLASVSASACGGHTGHPAVKVSITAPVDGATVEVPSVVVLGTIEPKNAVVSVAGRPAVVADGVFKRPMLLRAAVTRIEIVARAHGYVSSIAEISVSYKPRSTATAGRGHGHGRSGQSAPVAGRARGSSDGSGSSGAEADFVSGCSGTGGSVAGCVCVWHELVKHRFDTQGQWAAVVENWARSFMSRGVISFPPVVKTAVISCAPEFGASSP